MPAVPAVSRRAPPPEPSRLSHVQAAITWLFIVLGSTPLLASVLGVAWPFELASHFVVHAALGLLVYALLLLIRRRRGPALVALLASFAHAMLCAPLLVPAERAGNATRLRLVAANLLYSNDDPRAFAAWVKHIDPDFLVLLELNDVWLAALQSELDGYAHRIEIPRDDAFGIGLYSKSAPLAPIESLSVGPPWIAARTQHLGVPLTLVAIHTVPPISASAATLRDQQLRALAALAAREPKHFVAAGDLNATSWSPAFKRMLVDSPLIDTRRGFGLHGTWPNAWPSFLRIAIDHVLVSPDIGTRQREVGPDIGSDHRPVFVELEL